MAKKNTYDVTKTGPLTYRQLQEENSPSSASVNSPFYSVLRDTHRKAFVPSSEFIYEGPEKSPLIEAGSYLGESMFDPDYISEADYARMQENPEELRAENQPWYSKLGAGLTKGLALAGTTFIDGTVGLLAGIGTSIAKGRISGLWDNEVSNGLAEFNEDLEKILPNYRTTEEKEGPWYSNLDTVNFWADGVLKNLGFGVGAFYSGGAWLNGLKALGWVKGAMASKAIGSTLSGINEARIEANHTQNDILELSFKQIDDMKEKRHREILASDDTPAHKQLNLMMLENTASKLYEDAKNKAEAAGLTTFLGNSVLLTMNDYAMFGKLYARGFKNSKGLASSVSKAAEEMAAEKAGENVIKQGTKYAWNEITKKKAIARGLKNGLLEGNEEMAQAFISDFAGNLESYDSPDAYYTALIDPKAELETKDTLTALAEGFNNTYGNGDRWEEFAIGAFTGLLGMPTFGKVNNSDANTYLGKGSSVGLSGGLFGEIRNANQQNREGREAVAAANKYIDKIQGNVRHFVRSQSFTNAMDGWAEADNAFEYKNAEDNDDFSAISNFARMGKLNDLKEMVNQSFDNLTDEALVDIALHSSPNVKVGTEDIIETSNADGSPQRGGWRNSDGTLMSDTEEGREQMRKELTDKKNKIISEIDKYEKSVESVRTIGNNSLSEDQVNELAWLNWKVGVFTDRYTSIKNENQEFLTKLHTALQSFQRGRGQHGIDKDSKEGKQILKAMDNAELFIDALRNSETPLQLAALMKTNPNMAQFIEDVAYPILEDMVGVDAATFEKSMNTLKDTAKIAKASEQFNQRYKEFREDPIKLIKNRENINKKKDKVKEAVNSVNLKDKINNSNVSDIVKGVESGDLDTSNLDELFSDEDNEFLKQAGNNADDKKAPATGAQKVTEAKKIIETTSRMNLAIDSLANDPSITPEDLEDAKALLENSKKVSESEQELLDTATQAYNDPAILFDSLDPSLQNASREEIESVLGEKLDKAKSVIEQAKAIVAEQNGELEDLPDSSIEGTIKKKTFTTKDALKETTGHDATSTTTSENEKAKEDKAKEAAQKETEKEQKKVNDLFDEIRSELPTGTEKTFNKALSEVLNGIDMLIQAGASDKDLGINISNIQSYKTLQQLSPNIGTYLDTYITARRKQLNGQKEQKEEKAQQEKPVATPVTTEQEIRQQSTVQQNSNPNQGELTSTYQYWKPTLSLLPFGKAFVKGNNTPFYKLARTLKNANGTPMFTEKQLKRIEAVGKYLDEHGAFKLVDSGTVKAGDTVQFIINSTLNDEAGEIVILMTDSHGRIIGDVMSPNDVGFANQIGLPQFVERVTKEYQEAGSPQYFTSKEVTKVDKNMVGKVPYLADHEKMNTLNAIFVDGTRSVPFTLGIAVNSGKNARILASAGRTKGQGQSALEKTINPPLEAKAGQPFLLIPTSSAINHYMPVPITMKPYGPNTMDTMLGKAIEEVFTLIPTSTNNEAIKIISALEELISVQEIHINYTGDNVRVTIKPNKVDHQMTIYNGPKNAPNIVEQLKLGLQGQSFQISRKYINDEYKGRDYNRMIGEIAETNLPIGTTHTISDWFTIKPVDASGNLMKTKSPRSTGENPHAAQVTEIAITYGNMQLFVDPRTWTVTDGKKTYVGVKADKIKAEAFGIYTNQNMEKPYKTEWGLFDPKTKEFIAEEPMKVVKTLGNTPASPKVEQNDTTPTQDKVQEETPAQLEDKAKKAGLLGNKVRQAAWKALTPKQQSIVANKKGPKQKQWMDALEGAFNVATNTFDEAKLKGSVDTFLGRKGLYKRTDESQESQEKWDKEKELGWLSEVLPNLSTEDHLTIVEGLIKIADSKNPGYAYGKFQEGMMTISNQAARGTVYHEAFHAVTHTLLSESEYKKLFDVAAKRWGDTKTPVELEENMAEDFRRFMQSEEDWYDSLDSKNYGSIRRALAILFHKLKNRINELLGKTPYINKVFYAINRGEYSKRKVGQSQTTRYMREGFEGTVQEFQDIVDSLVNNGRLGLSRVGKNNKWGKLVDQWKSDGYTVKGYWNTKTKKWTVASSKKDAPLGESYYRMVEQHYRDKMMYRNLSQENRDYLKERGITIDEYNQMSQIEKEVLFHCKY